MKAMYLDCFSGISGNMFLGALLDAGVPEQHLREELKKLPVSGYEIQIERVKKCGISATYLDVKLHEHKHDHHHDHHEHHHRHLADILTIIHESALAPGVKANSINIFNHLAKAEAKVHGTSVEQIHFHEVGAVDAIIDIVGAAIGLDWLNINKIYTSRLHVGNGFIHCDHGVMPVPAPATAELLQNIPYYSGDIHKELVTPTGAAIIATLGSGFGSMPENFISQTIAYGAGTWELSIPNVLRMHIGELTEYSAVGNSDKIVVETNMDDLNPQVYEYVMDKLLTAGANDVWLTPIIMKKNRPATQLSVLTEQHNLTKIVNIIFTETSSIGMRYYSVDRAITERKFIQVTTDWGEIQVKVCTHNGQIVTISPEYEDCKKIAYSLDIPLKTIQQKAVENAWKYI
jgi:uncharacterized protein (TIGR00299 family) protein